MYMYNFISFAIGYILDKYSYQISEFVKKKKRNKKNGHI